MPWPLLLVAFLLLWAGVTLLIDGISHRDRRPDLAERLRPYQPRSVTDQAEEWLRANRKDHA